MRKTKNSQSDNLERFIKKATKNLAQLRKFVNELAKLIVLILVLLAYLGVPLSPRNDQAHRGQAVETPAPTATTYPNQ